MAKRKDNGDGPVVIKKYANRRLYDTSSSAYVTLDDLSAMVRSGVDFVVKDAKTGDDITRNVLTQIIFEQESRGENLLPIDFLRQLIGFYGNSMQAILPSYLDMSMDAFSRQQDKLANQYSGMAGTPGAYRLFEEMTRQNMAMFQNAMRMFSGNAAAGMGEAEAEAGDAETPPKREEDIDSIRNEMEALRQRLDTLSKKG